MKRLLKLATGSTILVVQGVIGMEALVVVLSILASLAMAVFVWKLFGIWFS